MKATLHLGKPRRFSRPSSDVSVPDRLKPEEMAISLGSENGVRTIRRPRPSVQWKRGLRALLPSSPLVVAGH